METFRRNGVYLGPVILASVVGNAVYGFAFATTAINVGEMSLPIDVIIAIVGAATAWRMTEQLGRMGWAVFALHHGIQALLVLFDGRMSSLWSAGLITLFAGLITASGARDASRRMLLLAGGVFVAACVAAFGARYYADELLGKHSVIQSQQRSKAEPVRGHSLCSAITQVRL